MTFTFHNPRKLEADEISPWNNLLGKTMASYNAMTDTQYKEPNLREALMKAKLYNQYYGPEKESEIGLRGAQTKEAGARTGLLGEQTKYFGPNAQSEMALRNAQMGLYGAQGKEAEAKARKAQLLADYLSGGSSGMQGGQPQQQSIQPQQQYQPGEGNAPFSDSQQHPIQQAMQQPQGQSVYGIPTPVPSREDVLNKMALGIDTFGPRQEQALKQQDEQRKAHMVRTQISNQGAESAQATNQLLDQYNYWMDKGLLTGPIGSKVKGAGLTTPVQNVNNIINRLIPEAMQDLRSKMGNAKFTNLDTSIATGMKPQLDWSANTRKFYTNSIKGFNDRMFEKAAFDRVASNPEMGISAKDADSLWEAYQKHHPIVKSKKSEELNKYEPNSWQKYLTPEALRSIREKGDYDSGDKPIVTPQMAKEELKRRRASKK